MKAGAAKVLSLCLILHSARTRSLSSYVTQNLVSCTLISSYFCIFLLIFTSHSGITLNSVPGGATHLTSLLKSLPKPRLWRRRAQDCTRHLCRIDWMSVPVDWMIAEWRHFSRQPRLVSSSSTVWVLCNIRDSPITDIILVSQSLFLRQFVQLLCSFVFQTSLEPIATIINYLQEPVCVSKMLSCIILLKQTLPQCANSALCPLSGVEDRGRDLHIALLENRRKLPDSSQGHQCLLIGIHHETLIGA